MLTGSRSIKPRQKSILVLQFACKDEMEIGDDAVDSRKC